MISYRRKIEEMEITLLEKDRELIQQLKDSKA
jgi:hypothetical protein